MSFHRVLCLASLLYASATGSYLSRSSVVDLGYAKYRGFVDNTTDITAFLGIRYAAAPTGSLRWTAPQTPRAEQATINATTQPPQCMQSDGGAASTNPYNATTLDTRANTEETTQSEDCLFLNVFTPALYNALAGPKLPVLVWIHGGGYASGYASAYDGRSLVTESNGSFVTVIIQYRLGLFGFLSGEAVKAGGALNAGLLDQDFALQWVHKHISKFGGDPNRVTIWGESAGAGSVLQHIVARNGQTSPQLFHGAIASSTFLPSQYAHNDEIPERWFSDVVKQANCSNTSDALTCLRGSDVEILQATNNAINAAAFYGTWAFVPVVDGSFIVRSPTLSLADGNVNGNALLTVTNAQEGTTFVSTTTTTDTASYAINLFPLLNASQAAAAAAVYEGVGDTLTQIIAIMSDTVFLCPTYSLLSAFAGHGFKSKFAVPPAYHGLDVLYYFPDVPVSPRPPVFNNTVFASAFRDSFFSFILRQNPNAVDRDIITPRWKPYAAGNTEMLFNKTIDEQPEIRSIATSDAVLERCRFWRSVSESTAQ